MACHSWEAKVDLIATQKRDDNVMISHERNPIYNLLMVVIFFTGVKLTCKVFLDAQKYLVVIFSKVACHSQWCHNWLINEIWCNHT